MTETRIIAVMNQKGGVGKTTTTVNLGAAMADLGRRTLLVDLDPQAHLTLHTGIDPSDLDASVYDLLTDPALDAAPLLRTINEHLAVLPAEVDLAGAEQDLHDAADRHDRLRSRLRTLADRFDVILLDCPPSLGLLTINALAAADEVIVPMQAHFLALQGLSKLFETVQLVRQNMNTALKVSGVILCMHDAHTRLAGEVVDDLNQFFTASRPLAMPWSGAVIYEPPIRRNIKLAECPSFGQTIFQYAPQCAGAEDYRALARAVLGVTEAPSTPTSDTTDTTVTPDTSDTSDAASDGANQSNDNDVAPDIVVEPHPRGAEPSVTPGGHEQ